RQSGESRPDDADLGFIGSHARIPPEWSRAAWHVHILARPSAAKRAEPVPRSHGGHQLSPDYQPAATRLSSGPVAPARRGLLDQPEVNEVRMPSVGASPARVSVSCPRAAAQEARKVSRHDPHRALGSRTRVIRTRWAGYAG